MREQPPDHDRSEDVLTQDDDPALPSAHNSNARTVVVVVAALLTLVVWLLLRKPDTGPPPAESTAEPIVEQQADRPVAQVLPAAATGAVSAGTLTPGFVRIEPGTFAMGVKASVGNNADAPRHTVTITRAFELQATETTQAQYRALVASNPSRAQACGPDCPVETVSWLAAARYCNRLSAKRGLPKCYVELPDKVDFAIGGGLGCDGYRLPTEAEWEFAARAGRDEDTSDNVTDIAWYDNNSGMRAHPVGTKKANDWGLYDMLGNVAEWVWDWQDDYPKGSVTDPMGPGGGKNKVFRGGSFKYAATDSAVGVRNGYGPGNEVPYIGFRCARTLR